MNVPIGIIVIIYGHYMFPKEKKRDTKVAYDWLGFVSYAIAIGSLFISIFMGQDIGFGNPLVIIGFVLSLLVWIIFVYIEKRKRLPLIDLNIFKNSRLTLSLISALLVFSIGYYAILLVEL